MVRVDGEALHPPDLAVDGEDSVVGSHFGLAERNGVADDDRRPVAEAHADPHAGGRTADPHAADVAVALDRCRLTVAAAVIYPFRQVDLLGWLEPLELGEGT